MRNRIASQPKSIQDKRLTHISNKQTTSDKFTNRPTTALQVKNPSTLQTKNLTLNITSPKIISPFVRESKKLRPSIIELLIAKHKSSNSKIRTPISVHAINFSRPATVTTPHTYTEPSSKTPVNFFPIEEKSKISPKGSFPLKNESFVQLENFILGEEIGKGAYAVVRSGKNIEDNNRVAVKVYDKSKLSTPSKMKNAEREIRILGRMNHSNIVKLYKTVENKNSLNLVMEYVHGCSLVTYLKNKQARRMEEDEARKVFHQILLALDYCHRLNISHRDIKLENILIDSNQKIKIIDFGFSTCFSNDKKFRLFCGTPSYMSPEIVSKQESFGPPCDIWAAGVVLYVLTTGTFPFKGSHSSDVYVKIQKGLFLIPSFLSPELNKLVAAMLSFDPQKRPTAKEALDFQWFKSKPLAKTQSISENIKEVAQITVKLNNTYDQKKEFF